MLNGFFTFPIIIEIRITLGYLNLLWSMASWAIEDIEEVPTLFPLCQQLVRIKPSSEGLQLLIPMFQFAEFF